MMCWDGLTTEQAARIGFGLGIAACAAAAAVAALIAATWIAWHKSKDVDLDKEIK